MRAIGVGWELSQIWEDCSSTKYEKLLIPVFLIHVSNDYAIKLGKWVTISPKILCDTNADWM